MITAATRALSIVRRAEASAPAGPVPSEPAISPEASLSPQDEVAWSREIGGPVLLPEPREIGVLVDEKQGSSGVVVRVHTLQGDNWISADQVQIPERREPSHRLDVNAHQPSRSEWQEYLDDHPRAYPNLTRYNYEVQSPASYDYNCIANSVRDEEHWIWPGDTISDFDEMYAEHGFIAQGSMDWSLQEHVEKAVLYADRSEDSLSPLHAVVQDEDGAFSSKQGGDVRLRVLDPRDIAGGDYGEPVKVYARYRSDEQAPARPQAREDAGWLSSGWSLLRSALEETASAA